MRDMRDSNIEWLGQIPKDWETTKLLNVLRQPICDGPHETPETVSADGIPFISVDSLNDTKRVNLEVAKKHISEQLFDFYNKKTNLKAGDILFSKAATIGKTAIVDERKFMVWSPLAVLKVDDNKSYNEYIYYLLNCSELIKHISLLGGYNTQINVGMRALERAVVPIPPIKEQKLISTVLETELEKADALIANEEAQIEKLKEYKQSLITELVTKGLDPDAKLKDSGVDWIGDIPFHWNTKKIKYIADDKVENSFIDGDWIESPYIENEGIRYYTTGNVGDGVFKNQGDGFISEKTFSDLNCKYAYGGDLVIARLNEPYGRSCILPSKPEKCILAVDIVILRPTRDFDKRFICYLTQCPNYHAAVADKARGTAMKRISRNNLGNVSMIVPPLEEQKKIANYLDDKCSKIETLIKIKQRKVAELNIYKKSLIYEFVTGKKEVS